MRKTMLSTVAVTLFLAAGSAGLAHAQAPTIPPRDARPEPARGTSSISGRVTAADSRRPLRRVRISIAGPTLNGPARTATTDSDGRYEVTELPAGRYRITVNRSGYLTMQYGQRRAFEQGQPLDVITGAAVKDIDFVLPRVGVISGRVLDEVGDPIEGVIVVAMRPRFFDGRRQLVPTGTSLTQTDDAGQYRILGLAPGTYVVRATTRETWTTVEAGLSRTYGYAPTFFPGTTSPGDGGQIKVGLGQEVSGIDISLVPGRSVSISGTAHESNGRAFENVRLAEEIRGEGFGRFGTAGSATVSASGEFVLRNVVPGEYTLTASTGNRPERPEVALVPLVVGSADISGLTLIGSQGGTVNGRIVTDSGTVPSIPGLRVSLAEARSGQPDPTLLGTFRNPGANTVQADGTFTIPGVFGQSRLRVTLPDEWMVRSIRQDGVDLIDRMIALRGGDTLGGVEIIVTNNVATVTGTVVDQRGAPLNDGTVLLFAADSAQWGQESRRVRAVRPDARGRFQAKGLPAGEYLAVAVEFVEDGAWNDPELLDSLHTGAQKVDVPDAGTVDVRLRLQSAEPASAR